MKRDEEISSTASFVVKSNQIPGFKNELTNARTQDEVAEWLRRWTANPLGSARVGSNPILVEPGSMV